MAEMAYVFETTLTKMLCTKIHFLVTLSLGFPRLSAVLSTTTITGGRQAAGVAGVCFLSDQSIISFQEDFLNVHGGQPFDIPARGFDSRGETVTITRSHSNFGIAKLSYTSAQTQTQCLL